MTESERKDIPVTEDAVSAVDSPVAEIPTGEDSSFWAYNKEQIEGKMGYTPCSRCIK